MQNMKGQDRIVVLIDMDCFYVQVEERDHPHIKGQPAAVVQYNSWKGGGIIAVNYEARDYGVKRGMRGNDAKEKCPSIHLVQVPIQRGKADLAKYRNAGREVITVLSEFSDCVERASIDEAYIDLTQAVHEKMLSGQYRMSLEDLPHTWVVSESFCDDTTEDRSGNLADWMSSTISGSTEDDIFELNTPPEKTPDLEHNIQLLIAAKMCEDMRKAVLEKTGFKCSAGISYNKMLSKLACGLHKPNRQTVLRRSAVTQIWSQTPVGKVRLLGGKLGYSLCEEFGCKTMSDLAAISIKELRDKFDEKTVQWLEGLGRGEDPEPVRPRQLPKTVGCSKNFPPNDNLSTERKLIAWIQSLTEELAERLEEDSLTNCRKAKTLTISIHMDWQSQFSSFSRSVSLMSMKADRLFDLVRSILNSTEPAKQPFWFQSIRVIGMSAGRFEDCAVSGTKSIQDMFEKTSKLPPIQPRRDPLDNKPVGEPSVSGSVTSDVPKKSFFQLYRERKHKDKVTTVENMQEDESNVAEKPSVADCLEGDKSTEFSNDSDKKQTNLDLLVENLNEDSCSSVYERSTDVDSPEISIYELFPDLNCVDESIVSMLPRDLKHRLDIALSEHHNIENLSLFTTCQECGKSVENYKVTEHMDFHVAVKLRQEQITEFRKQLQVTPKKQSKRGRKRASVDSDNSKMHKISKYFTK